MGTKIQTYRDLLVWQRSMDVATDCFKEIEKFPKDQQYAMSSQIWRAAYSVPSNIAEGFSRGSTQEFIRFLWISHGSLRELETHIMLCSRVGLMSVQITEHLLKPCEEIGKMLHALINSLEKKKS
jgi:four helix bundle protein